MGLFSEEAREQTRLSELSLPSCMHTSAAPLPRTELQMQDGLFRRQARGELSVTFLFSSSLGFYVYFFAVNPSREAMHNF